MAAFSLPVPFTVTDLTYQEAFKLYLNNAVGSVEEVITGPLLACVTIWVIVQGILVMRGDIDARQGVTKLISVSLVVGLVTSSSLYQANVQTLFETAIPSMVQQLGGNFGLPNATVPYELDAAFRLGQVAFLTTSAGIPQGDVLDSLAFEGAQGVFYFSLWSIFAIYDLVSIMTSVLVTFGPLFIVGFLFDSTKGITKQWIGQLISYAILLLLVSVVAAAVVATILAFMTATFAASLFLTATLNTRAGQLVGLYEMDMFILTGNAIVVALPAIASSIGGGVAAQGSQMGQSVVRHFARGASDNTIRNIGMMQP